MAVVKQQQLHAQQPAPSDALQAQFAKEWPIKSLIATLSADLDTVQPGTPIRVSSSSRSSNGLQSQYSEDEEDSKAFLQPFKPLTPVPASLAKQQQQQKQKQQVIQHKEEHEWTAARQAAAVVVACVTWIFISSATILINKHIMVDLSFSFPAAVSALGMFGTTVASFLACCVFKVVPCKASISPYFYFTCIMTTGFLIALSFQAGNTAYLYLSVAFVQMLKAFTPVSTMFSGFMLGLEKPSAKLIAAVGCISCGVLLSSCGEVNFSAFGVVAMLLSIAAEGLRTGLMQHLLASKKFHPFEAWMYLGPACIVWLFVLIGMVEAQDIRSQQALSIVVAHKWYFAFAAIAGFAVNALAMLVIKLASALTLKVLGICKDVGLVLFGVLLLGEHVAGLQMAGYAVALVGFGAYNYIKAMPASKLELPRQLDSASKKPVLRQHSTVYLSSNGGSSTASSTAHLPSRVAASSSSSSSSMAQQLQQFRFSLPGSASKPASGLQEPLLPPAVLVCSKNHHP